MAGELTDNRVRALLAEGLRAELKRMIALQDAADLRGDEEIDVRITELEEENRTLRRLAHRKEFDVLEPWIAEAAGRVRATAPSEIDPEFGRRSAKLRMSLCAIEIAVLDGGPADEAAAEIARDYSTAAAQEFVRAPVTLSAALAKTKNLYPSRNMQGNLKICGDLLLARFGDIPVCTVDEDMLLAFFARAHRLPKAHGKRANGPRRKKDEGIATADVKDAEPCAEVRVRPNLSTEERRHLLAEKLVPRITLQTIERHRASVNRVFEATNELGFRGLAKVPGYAKVERLIRAIENDAREERDALCIHVAKPKGKSGRQVNCAACITAPCARGIFGA
jgi:hypothetical protein